MTVMEVTRLRVEPGESQGLRDARGGMVRAFEARPGFIRASLVQVKDDEWLDLIEWASSEDFAESRRRGGDSPEVAVFFAQIDEVLSMEEGELWAPDGIAAA